MSDPQTTTPDPTIDVQAIRAVAHALADGHTQAPMIQAITTLIVTNDARRHSMTMAEMQTIDALRAEALNMPLHVRRAMRRWEHALVGSDPDQPDVDL